MLTFAAAIFQLIMNAIRIPIHLTWLEAGAVRHRLELSDRTHARTNMLMALSMLGVVILALVYGFGGKP